MNSEWVEKEVLTAFEKEKTRQGELTLFPIRLDEAVMNSLQEWAGEFAARDISGISATGETKIRIAKPFNGYCGTFAARRERHGQ